MRAQGGETIVTQCGQHLLPSGVSREQAAALLEEYRQGKVLAPADLFLLLLRLAMPGEQEKLQVDDQEREQLQLALAPYLN